VESGWKPPPKSLLIRTVSIVLAFVERNHPTEYKTHFIRGSGRLEAEWSVIPYFRHSDISDRKLPNVTKHFTLAHVQLNFHSDDWIEKASIDRLFSMLIGHIPKVKCMTTGQALVHKDLLRVVRATNSSLNRTHYRCRKTFIFLRSQTTTTTTTL
jgi:hypothetical protein